MLGGASPNRTGDLSCALGAVKSLTRMCIPVISYEAKKGAEMFHCLRRLHGKNSFDFLWVWFESIRCEPIVVAKEIYFFDGTFAFSRIDDKCFSAKGSENCANED